MRRMIAIVSLVFVLVIAVGVPVRAFDKSNGCVDPSLNFSGNTAICKLYVEAISPSSSITATVKLKNGTVVIKQWTNLTAIGELDFSDTAIVTSGCTYTLSVTLEINGVPVSVNDITKICP